MTEVLFVRHGLPVAGVADPELAEEGTIQAKRLTAWLAAERVDALATSPLRRARQTAAVLAAELGFVPTEIADLREWEPREPNEVYTPIEQMAADDPRASAVAEGRYGDFVPDLDQPAFITRARDCLEQIFEIWPSGRVVAVSHGGIINAILAGVIGTPDLFWFNPGYTSVSRVEKLRSGRVVVHSANETGHLLGSRP
ncbi:histidine phosphatase family protein [Frankia sp. Cppng1_Ct_nod]|uniref:histidine phosphatase family protein n=1 Tax=Frankia sp. Cppng1_Ct_nod TaxID=2897162 RepID=UPI0020254BF1|nr:histidine phosphatase family protein [Frankia sp. Cppng1_Ct_nod]